MSFQEWTISGSTWIGLDNYQKLLGDRVFMTALRNTIVYSAGAVPLSIVVGLASALGVNEKLRGRIFFRAIFLVPYLLSWVVIALAWRWLYSPHYGLLNTLLKDFGLPPYDWLQNPDFVLIGLIIAAVWGSSGFFMVIFLAGLQSIPEEYYEAAKIDGASSWGRFRHITLPMLRPVTLLVTFMAVILSWHVFDLIWVMTGGGPGNSSLVMVVYIYNRAFEAGDIGYASALATILFLVIFVFTIFQARFVQWDEA
jgi:multiple sugar transport system permease protein